MRFLVAVTPFSSTAVSPCRSTQSSIPPQQRSNANACRRSQAQRLSDIIDKNCAVPDRDSSVSAVNVVVFIPCQLRDTRSTWLQRLSLFRQYNALSSLIAVHVELVLLSDSRVVSRFMHLLLHVRKPHMRPGRNDIENVSQRMPVDKTRARTAQT